MLISSCEKFSDLWQQHIRLYRENWMGEPIRTYLVTDRPTEAVLEGVEIIVAPSDYDFPMRIQYALQYIETDYVLLTLDDYFLIHPVSAENIATLAEKAKEGDMDYLLLYDRRKDRPKDFRDLEVLEPISLEEDYAVNLYPAIWKKSFLDKTVTEDLSPWLYEVSLTKTAKKENARCFFSPSGSFLILDVVRKGKVLHKANAYFKKHAIDIGDRPLISRRYELRLALMDFIKWHTPRCCFLFLKKVAKKCGMKFYS